MNHDDQATQHSSLRTITVCVDDVGLNARVNEAALALVHQGRVHALSAMVGAPMWGHAARYLRDLNPMHVDVGLHLDFTECPLSPHVHQPLRELVAKAYLGRLDVAGLRQEIRNQLTAFEDAMGRAPAYVDGHQHVHQLPQVRDVLIEELSRRDQSQNVWLRATRAAPHEAHADLATCAKSWVIAHLGAQGLAQLAHAHGMRQNRRLLGVYGFDGDAQAYRARLVRWLDSADEADLLMCHVAALPSNGWLLTPQDDPIGRARTEEYSVWSAADLGDLLEQSGCSFAPMSSILRDRRVGG